jgi:4-amino-4-deoxy-L-arabinose transferase-like glycosyltransferase
MSTKKGKKTHTKTFHEKLTIFFEKYHIVWLALILGIFLYLRYYNLDNTVATGFDQARDAFKVRDILHGQLFLQGPWTGNGHLHTGPLYFYLLAPFFLITNLDPIASDYFNILVNIFNFAAIYFVISKLFNKNWGLLAVLIYTFNSFYIQGSVTAWNVSPMIGLASFIFYGIIKIYEGKYKWFYVVAALAGLYFHAHFTAAFWPPIILLSLIFLKNKKKAFKYILLSLPLYLVWFVPNILAEVFNQNSDAFRYREFAQYFLLGFHLKFFLYRLPYNFILFAKTFSIFRSILQFLVPIAYAITVIFFEKDKKQKIIAYIIFCFFLVPIIGFSLYAGPVSEYYSYHVVPAIFYILIYLQSKIIKQHRVFLLLLAAFWIINFYFGTRGLWIKDKVGGINMAKIQARTSIFLGKPVEFNEGSMVSYFYTIWTKDGKRF